MEVKPPPVTISSIVVDGGPRVLEIGTIIKLTATASDSSGKAVPGIPFVWRSTVDSIASFAPDGQLTAKDTGSTKVTASALGISSGQYEMRVVWFHAATIDTFHWNPPNAVIPGVAPVDSVRVIVLNPAKNVPLGDLVRFKVTEGGGTVSPEVVTVKASGTAATKWTLGPAVGKNTITATVVDPADSVTPIARVKGNGVKGSPVTISIKAFAPLVVVTGDAQTGDILSSLPVVPSVKLVDTLGNPRAGIPITFTPNGNGRVARTIVPTGVDGIASPGVWTLGDLSGDEQLVASVEAAKITIHATANGTTVHYAANQIATSQQSTCALTNDQLVACLGRIPQIGTGDTVNVTTPTLTKGSLQFNAIVGASTGAHYCGITSLDLAIYCWGVTALVDTSGKELNAIAPTRFPGNTAWLKVTAGAQHNCAIASDNTAYCWGADTSGQLGDNGTTQRFTPAPVAGGFKFSAITAGASHTCALTLDGTPFCWGLNASGQLGDGTSVNKGGPTALSGGLKFQSIGAGNGWTCGLSGGKAYCWGAGTAGNVPTLYANAPLFSSLSVGSGHACGLTSDGTAYCWGANATGELGDSTTTNRTTPTAVSTDLKFKAISAAADHTCALTLDGFVACWGRNTVGEIGLTVPTLQLTPRYIVLGVTPPPSRNARSVRR